MTGLDVHSHFLERASLNKAKYFKDNSASIRFLPYDFLYEKDDNDHISSLDKIDVATFGFAVTMESLEKRANLFKTGANLLVPLSADEPTIE